MGSRGGGAGKAESRKLKVEIPIAEALPRVGMSRRLVRDGVPHRNRMFGGARLTPSRTREAARPYPGRQCNCRKRDVPKCMGTRGKRLLRASVGCRCVAHDLEILLKKTIGLDVNSDAMRLLWRIRVEEGGAEESFIGAE